MSPGSRSTPLTIAVASHPAADSIVHFDERGTAFFAVGHSLANNKPAALISTSGTAVANFYPAIVEASMNRVPLIVITADRPPELRQTGANQTIDQVKVFSNYVRWQVDLPCPSHAIKPEVILTTIDQAVYHSSRSPAGPVHINIMFREPFLPESLRIAEKSRSCSGHSLINDAIELCGELEFVARPAWGVPGFSKSNLNNEQTGSSTNPLTSAPDRRNNQYPEDSGKRKTQTNSEVYNDNIAVIYRRRLSRWLSESRPWTHYAGNRVTLSATARHTVLSAVNSNLRGLIIVGKLDRADERESVRELIERLNWPAFADITYGLRLGARCRNLLYYADHLTRWRDFDKACIPETILQIGGQLVSRNMRQFICHANPNRHIIVNNHPYRSDPDHGNTDNVEIDIVSFCEFLMTEIEQTTEAPMYNELENTNKIIDDVIENFIFEKSQLSEPAVARLISRHIGRDSGLVLAASMPVRDMNVFGAVDGPNVIVAANRGASGIDGTLATAAGFAANLGRTVTVLAGDLAVLHDLNSLALIKGSTIPVIVVVLNNNGGGIFSFLPISNQGPAFETFFGTPHNVDFCSASAMFDLDYAAPRTHQEFIEAYKSAHAQNRSAIIEIKTDRSVNFSFHEKLDQAIIKRLESGIKTA